MTLLRIPEAVEHVPRRMGAASAGRRLVVGAGLEKREQEPLPSAEEIQLNKISHPGPEQRKREGKNLEYAEIVGKRFRS